MSKHYEKIAACADYIRSVTNIVPKVGLVLGSGLGGYADEMEVSCEMPYSDIPGFPVSTVPGHDGRFIIGHVGDIPVIAMKGRVHYYEGYSMSDVVLPVRVMAALGTEYVILTNAVGAVNKSFRPGDYMVIDDHITTFIPSPLTGENVDELGERFPDMSSVYDPDLRACAGSAARECGMDIRHGVYVQLSGPQYETKAEVDMLRVLGADATGMSTACEAVAAHHAGMRVCGISFISNMACGAGRGTLSHREVQVMADACAGKFASLVTETIRNIGRLEKAAEDDEYELGRFLRAQEGDYRYAYEEIVDGRKMSHWMWYVFPQMRGLGRSEMAERFGIAGLDEARAYMDHPVLGQRLIDISRAMLAHRGKSAEDIFGYTDAMKLRSCMTLFELASDEPVLGEVLDAFYDGERDEMTLNMLAEKSKS